MKQDKLTNIDYLVAHEATAFANRHWEEFREFLTRNRPEVALKIVQTFGRNEEKGTALIIGKFFRESHKI